MAKKQQKNTGGKKTPKRQNTDIVNTNAFIKGMNKDTDSGYFDKQSWYHARNLINNSVDGDLGVVGNEPANLRCAKIPYTVIGGIHLYGDQWVIYSTNDILSEIGLFDDSECKYTTLVNDDCLNFNKDNLIIGAAKENFDCTWQIYWDDGLNPSRTLNIDNIPYVQIVDPNTPAGSTCINYINAEPLMLDCERIRLAPLIDIPCIKLEKADQGGLLENGSYQVYAAYCINEKPVTDYLGISNIQPIWSREDTQGSLTIELSNLDTEFDQLQIVVRSRIKGQATNTVLGLYSTETKSINIDYINAELPKVLSSTLQRRIPTYEKSEGMFVVNDYLIRSQPTEQFDFNYQPLANNIQTYWTSTQYPSNYYREGGNKPTLLRDEQYAFFIRFIYNTGEKSASYHIPGRAPTAADELPIGGAGNNFDNSPTWRAGNTASSQPGNPFVASLLGTNTDDGGTIIDGGLMGFWESTEVYSPTDPTRYGNLCGQPIRHHKIPDETVPGIGTTLTGAGETIHVIGAAFDNIAPPVDNDGNVIPNIIGYEILVGSRAGNRSILAKGIMKHMFRFRRTQNDGIRNAQGSPDNFASGTGLMPNYPFNDLRADPYLIGRDSNSISQLPWYAQFGTAPEENWHRGNTNQADGLEFNTVDARTFTFHSPELNFSRLYLNPTTVKIYKTVSGIVLGRFKKSEEHPRMKLLKNRAATVAALVGVGYALAEMRGKRNYKIDTMQSTSIGEFGAHALGSGSHMSPFVGPGTGLAAANVGASSASIWLGAAADVGFNTLVDIGAIFGAGKVVRQVGTPIYQQVEVASTAAAAGHIGPKRSIQYMGSDFSSIPSLMSIAIGIISFLNYVAVGGDKIIDLILNLIGFQNYAMKYISHGYYQNETPFLGTQFRQSVDRARYIKSAIQSFDGQDVIYNNLRPSTVVFKVANPWGDSLPGINGGPIDNTKFTIGAGANGCAGNGNNSMSWYNPGEEVESTAVAHYMSFKTLMDNQYGQLDSIIQLTTQNCFYFRTQQNVDPDGNILPIISQDRFSTDTVYAGDSYICRYTEKSIMPFFFDFLKEGRDGIPFDYSKYANVPFPRFWMNSEKFRMDQFVRPITSLRFRWNGTEALPSGYYNMDCPENGGYCAPQGVFQPGTIGTGLGANFGEGGAAGSTQQDGSSAGSGAINQNQTGFTQSSAVGGAAWDDPNDDWNLENSMAAYNNRFQVINIGGNGNGGSDIPYNINMGSNSERWSIIGAGQDVITITPAAGVLNPVPTNPANPPGPALAAAVETTPNFNITIEDHSYSVPLDSPGNGPSITKQCGCDFVSFVREDTDDSTFTPSLFSDFGTATARLIWDWSSGTFIGMTNVATGFYASNDPTITAGGTGNPSDVLTSSANFTFQSGLLTNQVADNAPIICNNTAIMSQGAFQFPNAQAPGPGAANDISAANQRSGVQAGGPGDPQALADNAEQAAQDSVFVTGNQPGAVGAGGTATGGLFVIKTGYMYTHNCGINDFWVESSMNLAYRDYEDVPRKQHYDDENFTDLVELFHAKIVNLDNYYFYDRSTSVDKFWGSSWGRIQPSYYDPLIAENCFIKYPKRLLYSVPATGFKDKATLSNKNDAKQDFWRVYLTENFRDFKAKVTTIKPINETGALIFFPTMSPKMFQGQDRLQLSNTKLTIGDGGLFSQAFQNITNSDVSHEYGSCESARSVLNTPFGIFFVSQAQGKIFQYRPGGGLTPISDQGMKWWMNKFLPSKLLEYFPLIEDCPEAVDNPVNGAGIQTVYDPNNDIVYFCKKDFIPLPQFQNNDCIEYIPCEGFVYNATNCEGLPQVPSCPEGYTLIQDPVTGQDVCQLLYTEEPIILATEQFNYGAGIAIGTDLGFGNNGTARYGVDWPIVIDDVFTDGMPTNQADPNTWHYITDNGSNAWWRNANPTNGTNGIINRLMRGAAGTPGGQFAQAEFQINIPTAKTVHILLAADNAFALDLDTGTGYTNFVTPVDATIFGAVTQGGGIWNPQAVPGGNFAWLSGDAVDASQYSKAWIYKLDLPSGCTKFRMTGTNNGAGFAGLAAAVIDVNDYQDIQDATSWESLPKLWDSETYDFIVPGTTTDFRCPPNFTIFTDGTDGSTEECPVCREDIIIYNCDCMTDPTSNIPGVLIGTCPDAFGNAGSSYCQYEGYADVEMIDQTYPIEVLDTNYFKDISWTISYDPKTKAWLSFHDWHPKLAFNSIRHFLTTNTEMTEVPQCPDGYTWNGTRCCLSLHHEELAEVNVTEFLSTVESTPATVQAFSETMDIVIVIDFSTSMRNNGGIGAAMQFVSTFVSGMAPGMLGGPYAGQVRIGHGRWGSGSASASPPGDPAQIVGLTDDPAIAGGSLTATNTPIGQTQYWPQSGTTFNDGIDLANTMLTGSTAQQKIVIFVTDAGSAPNNPTNLANATQLIALFVDNATSANNCSTTTGYGDDLGPLITDTGLPSNPAYDVVRCANVGTLPRNVYHIGSGIDPGEEGHAASVAQDLVQSFTQCTCTQGIIDTSPLNPPCLPLPSPPPQCITCSCPPGFTLIGTCDNSQNPPICRKMDCECTSPLFNPDEDLTISGECDDIVQYFNPLTGTGNPTYVNTNPLFCIYDYEDCVPANYELGFFWKHNIRTDLFNNYYDKNYPWEVDIIETTGQQVTTLRSIEYQMEAYLYQNEGKDRFHDLDYNFDEAVIYNSEQVSGLLELELEPKNNVQLSMLYPIVGPNSIRTLFSKVEQKYRFNQFFDITADRGEFTAATNTIWETDWDGYVRTLNPANLNYNKAQHQRKKFRHYFNHVLLRKSDEAATTRKMLLKLENTKLNVSFR